LAQPAGGAADEVLVRGEFLTPEAGHIITAARFERIAIGHRSREQFLTDLTLDPPDMTSDRAGVPLLAAPRAAAFEGPYLTRLRLRPTRHAAALAPIAGS
jgi:hypothetical protein